MRGLRGYHGGYHHGSSHPRYGAPRMAPYSHYSNGSGNNAGNRNNNNNTALPYNNFDAAAQSEPGFQRVYPLSDDKALLEALLQRNQDLTPSAQDQAAVSALLTKIYSFLETLVLNPSSFEPAQIEEVKQVGSFKKCTMIASKNVADIVVVFRTLPTKEAVTALANKLLQDYRNSNRTEWISPAMTPAGFDIVTRQASLRCLVATIPANLRLLDENLHVPKRDLVETHLAAIRHVKWFDENANNTSVRALVKILRDMKYRFSGLSSLNSWMIELLAHHTFSNRSADVQLGLAPAFRRCLQLLAGGIFLPGAAGIADPCEPAPLNGGHGPSVHDSLSFEEMDRICFTAQTLLRVNSHGGSKHVLGLEGNSTISTDMSVWGSIIVTASEAAYDSSEVDRWEQEDACELAANELISSLSSSTTTTATIASSAATTATSATTNSTQISEQQ